MRRTPTPKGRYLSSLYYEDDEIDQICLTALTETDLLPSKPDRIRIDRLIEKKFTREIIYESLDGMLGFTDFGPTGVEAVHIGEPPGDLIVQEERRVNSTLAHEAGHCLLHTSLYIELYAHHAQSGKETLPPQMRISCRTEQPSLTTKSKAYSGEWWEYQANHAIGALLMPQPLVSIFLEPFHKQYGTTNLSQFPKKTRRAIIEAASRVFDVNQSVARFRLNLPY